MMWRSAAAALLAAAAGVRGGDGLLIVAPAEFAAGLEEFVGFKSERLPTELVTLSAALEQAEGADDAERLKRYLFERWRADGVRYVLLVGDADVVPVRYMVLDRNTDAAFNYAFYPSDLYYGDIAERDGSFESWNARSDGFHAGYFGEVRGEHFKSDPINYDGVDYRPELAVGRWPVNSAEQLAVVAAKSMRYERGVEREAARMLDSAEPWGRRWPARAGLVMVGGWVDARPRFEQLREELQSRFDVERLYYEGESFEAGEPTAERVVGLLNDGVGLLIHAGHGSDTTWHDCIGTGNLGQVQNGDRLAVVVSAGCSTARFATLPPYEPYEDVDGVRHGGTNHGEVFTGPPPAPACYARGEFNMTGLGEQMVIGGESGAVAYIGCNTGSQPCGLTLVDGFAEAVATLESPRLGDCWNFAVDRYWEREGLATIEATESWYPASIFFQGMKFMVFGDPTIPVGAPGR